MGQVKRCVRMAGAAGRRNGHNWIDASGTYKAMTILIKTDVWNENDNQDDLERKQGRLSRARTLWKAMAVCEARLLVFVRCLSVIR